MPDPEPARGGDKPGISNGAGGSSNSAVAPVRAKAAKAKLVRRKPRKKVVIALDNIRPAKGPDDLVWLPSGSKASPPQKQPVEKDQEAAETKEGPSESSKMAAPLKETSTAATAAAANETKSTQKDLASISRRGSSASVPPSPMATAISNGAYSSTSGNSGKEYARRSNGRLNNNETDGSFLKGATQEKQLNKGDHQNLASNPSNLAAEEEEDNFTTSSNSIHPSQFEDAEEDETKNAIVSSTPAQPTSSVASSGRKYDMEMSQFANAPVEILSDEIMGATKSNKGTSTDLEKNSSSGNNSSTGVSGNSTGPALSTCVSNVATTKTVQNNSYNTAHRDIQNKLSSTDRSSTGSGSEEKQKQAPAHSLRRNASSIEPNRESQTQVSSKLIHDKKAPSGLEHQSNGSQYSGSKDSNDDYDSSSDDENLADLTSKEHALFRNIQKDIDRQEEQECFQQLEDDIDQQEEREKLQKLEGETNRKSKGVAGDSENLRDKGRQQQTPANGKLERSQRKDNSSSDILDVSSNRPKERRSKHDAGVASSTNSKRAPTTTSIIRASKLVPRLEPYLSIETFPIQVLEPFYEHLSSRGFTEDSMVHFSASLANPMDGDQTSLVLTVEGQRAVVDEFRDFFFFNWLNVLWARKCHQQLLQDKRTVQLDVLLNKDSLLKVWAEELLVEVSLQGRSQGLWVDLTTCSPALENLLKDLLGESAFQSDTLTVAILSINNSQCETSEEWNQLGNHLQEISDEQVTAKLCVCGYVDLDSMPRDGAPLPCFVTVDKKNDIVSDIDASLASRSQSPPSDKEMPKGKTSGASAAKAFHQFKAKYTEVYKIEYSLSDIGFQFVMSQMWIQHKIEYSSEACGNECPCAFGLDKMTKLVSLVIKCYALLYG